jgi:hypothetical protein
MTKDSRKNMDKGKDRMDMSTHIYIRMDNLVL